MKSLTRLIDKLIPKKNFSSTDQYQEVFNILKKDLEVFSLNQNPDNTSERVTVILDENGNIKRTSSVKLYNIRFNIKNILFDLIPLIGKFSISKISEQEILNTIF